MSAQCLTSNRRDFLSGTAGTVAAVATLPAVTFAAANPRAAWDAAMARRKEADRACLRYDAEVADAAYRREKAEPGWKASESVWEESERLTDVFSDAETELMEMPAPDRAALRWKLDKIIEPDEEHTPAWSMSYVRQTIADYRRLLGDV